MTTKSIEKMAHDIGFDIGQSNDIAQADLLNGLGEGLSYLSKLDYATQLVYVTRELTKSALRMIGELHEFAELKEQ